MVRTHLPYFNVHSPRVGKHSLRGWLLVKHQDVDVFVVFVVFNWMMIALQSPLHYAAASTHGAMCLELLVHEKCTISVQCREGRTPLHMTALHGRFTRAQTLIQNGKACASINR